MDEPRVCVVCGTPLKTEQKSTCSRACRGLAQQKRETRQCALCGADFEAVSWQKKRHCSQRCGLTANRGRKYATRDRSESRACIVCGIAFTVGGRGQPRKDQERCSMKCQQAGRYRHGMRCAPMSDTDAAYAAGLMDGEGSVILYQRGDIPSVTVMVTLVNTDRAMIEWLISTTELGTLEQRPRRNPNHRGVFVWKVTGDGAVTFLMQVRPYLITKAAQADLGIETQERMRVPALKADHTWQVEYRLRMKDLNARGARAIALADSRS